MVKVKEIMPPEPSPVAKRIAASVSKLVWPIDARLPIALTTMHHVMNFCHATLDEMKLRRTVVAARPNISADAIRPAFCSEKLKYATKP